MLPGVLIGAGVALFIGLFVTLAVVSYKRNQARLAALQSLCLSKGWQYSAADPFNLPERWPGAPFGRGYGRRAGNVVTGEVGGHPMIAFDYEFKEDSTDSKGNRTTTTYHYGVCALGMPCPLPEVSVGPENVFTRIGNAIGGGDIDLESEEFNRRFRVRSDDRKLACDVLPPRTMELLLAYGKVDFRFCGRDIVSAQSGSIEAADVLNRTGLLAAVLAGIPDFVWKDHAMPEAAQ